MAYLDLIPDIFPLTMPNLATGQTYRTTKFNVSDKLAIGITVKASQALSVALAYGATSDTAAAAGVGGSASLPFMTAATSFASVTGAEGGTYHEISVPPSARQAQLVISNASGSTVSGATIDAALRVVAYPAASGSLSADGIVDLFAGTPDGTKFLRDDGTLATPAGGSPAIADITDWPSGLTATEIGYVNGVTSAIQTQLDAKLDDPTGTPNGSKYLRDDNSWQAVSATDSTKLALDGSNTMTGPVNLGNGASIDEFATGAIQYNTASGRAHTFSSAGVDYLKWGAGYGIGFLGTQISWGASVANIWRNSAGALNCNVPTGQFHYFTVNGGSDVMLGASCVSLTNNATPDTTGYQLSGHSGGVTVTAPSAKAASLCSAGGGTTLPEVVVHGLSETAYAGAVEIKAGSVTRSNTGTWVPIFSLAKGVHTGEFTLAAYRVTGDFHAVNVCWEIEGTTLNGPYSPNASSEWDWSFVAAGSVAAGNISLRVNSGSIEINVGTSVESDVKFSINFDGMVN